MSMLRKLDIWKQVKHLSTIKEGLLSKQECKKSTLENMGVESAWIPKVL